MDLSQHSSTSGLPSSEAASASPLPGAVEATPTSDPETLTALGHQLNTGSEKSQLQALAALEAAGTEGQAVVRDFLLSRPSGTTTRTALWVEGRAYEILLRSQDPAIRTLVETTWPTGVVPLRSAGGIDYQPLQHLLATQQFQAADQLTLQQLCQLAGAAAIKRKWLYFTEVEGLPSLDLQTLDQLWLAHSEGKFGFSVQRQLWLGVGKNWEALWPKIGWKTGKIWTRYPQGFTWNLTAPRGHLPLSNQLRGVQVFNALLCHPTWTM